MQTYLLRVLSSIWFSQLKEGKEAAAYSLLPSCCLLLRDSHWAFGPCLSLAQVYCVWELDVAWWAGWPFMGWFNWRILIVSWCEGILAQPTLSILRYIQEAGDSYQVIEVFSILGKVETLADLALKKCFEPLTASCVWCSILTLPHNPSWRWFRESLEPALLAACCRRGFTSHGWPVNSLHFCVPGTFIYLWITHQTVLSCGEMNGTFLVIWCFECDKNKGEWGCLGSDCMS